MQTLQNCNGTFVSPRSKRDLHVPFSKLQWPFLAPISLWKILSMSPRSSKIHNMSCAPRAKLQQMMCGNSFFMLGHALPAFLISLVHNALRNIFCINIPDDNSDLFCKVGYDLPSFICNVITWFNANNFINTAFSLVTSLKFVIGHLCTSLHQSEANDLQSSFAVSIINWTEAAVFSSGTATTQCIP